MLRRRVVLVGTGTGVGKTYVGSQLLRAWRRSGITTLSLKPVESGISPSGALDPTTDAGALAAQADHGSVPLYALPQPISPHLAAQDAGMRIDLGHIKQWVHAKEDEHFGMDPVGTGGITLVETAGGAFSPLNEEATNFDLALLLQPALIVLVGPDSLGVLHDVSATLRAMAPTAPALVTLSQARPADSSTGRNATELERVVFPRLPNAPHDREVITISEGEKADFLADRILQMAVVP